VSYVSVQDTGQPFGLTWLIEHLRGCRNIRSLKLNIDFEPGISDADVEFLSSVWHHRMSETS